MTLEWILECDMVLLKPVIHKPTMYIMQYSIMFLELIGQWWETTLTFHLYHQSEKNLKDSCSEIVSWKMSLRLTGRWGHFYNQLSSKVKNCNVSCLKVPVIDKTMFLLFNANHVFYYFQKGFLLISPKLHILCACNFIHKYFTKIFKFWKKKFGMRLFIGTGIFNVF